MGAYLSGVTGEVRRFSQSPPALMERSMLWLKADGEVAGAEMLNVAVIAGATLLLLGALWSPAPGGRPVETASAQPIEQVVVIAHPSHVS
jgi:hypothetical protein